MRIAISGAGNAGTTLAYWLLKAGHDVTLIERAPELRTGGYIVDFWGLGYTLAEKMGLKDQVQREGYHQKEVRFVDDASKRAGGFSTEVVHELTGGRFTTIRRGALVKIVYDLIKDEIETIFDNSIASIEETESAVSVTLENAGRRDFDLLVGADGLHSKVRALHFGPEADFETYMGYAVAAFEVTGYRPRDELIYVIHPTASHQLARFALRDDRTLFLLIFRADPKAADARLSAAQVKSLLKSEVRGVGWEAPQILRHMDGVDDVYFDRMSQIRMPGWHKGRVALVGDAAAAVSLLAGEGTGLAMVEAYVLAGELHRAGSDVTQALANYESRLRKFIDGKQKTAAKSSGTSAPKTELGVWLRNQATKLMSLPGFGSLFLGQILHDGFDLPDYYS